MALLSPVMFDTVGQSIQDKIYVINIVWHGATTAGGEAVLHHLRPDGAMFWGARAVDVHTYGGIVFGGKGALAHGLRLATLSGGVLLVYYNLP